MEMIPYDAVSFCRQEIPLERVMSLTELVKACEANKVEISKVHFFQNGFQVLFADLPGDAILHDGSCGRKFGMWETIGYPWDYNDVSVHEPDVLAKMLAALKSGKDWQEFDV